MIDWSSNSALKSSSAFSEFRPVNRLKVLDGMMWNGNKDNWGI